MTFTQTETTFHYLVMFGRPAEHAYERMVKGDNFIAEGYTRTVNYEREDGQAVQSEEFVAKKIGHDANEPVDYVASHRGQPTNAGAPASSAGTVERLANLGSR